MILDSRIFAYYVEYLSSVELGAKTIISEHKYIDHDYLLDYSGYYVRCFNPPKRECIRLHFFAGASFDDAKFKGLLSRSPGATLTLEQLQANYLGFLIIRPLPQTVFGRTCLKSKADCHDRDYRIIRSYEVSLFGLRLSVDSLAFQQQDHDVGACATCALWSVFHYSSTKDQHNLPSPVEITVIAGNLISDSDPRSLPNSGLSITQLAYTIKNVGLEPATITWWSKPGVRSTIYAYLRGGIPMIAVCYLFDTGKPCSPFLGAHAVALTGYSLEDIHAPLDEESSFGLKGSRLKELYVHDDQVGPFAEMRYIGSDISVRMDGQDYLGMEAFSTSWRNLDEEEKVIAILDTGVIPLYNKIRIEYSSVLDCMEEFCGLYDLFVRVSDSDPPLPEEKEWDIHLVELNDWRQEILNSDYLHDDYRHSLLVYEMPRFLWRARLEANGRPYFDFLFDATDLNQGRIFLIMVEYVAPASLGLAKLFSSPKLKEFDYFTPTVEIIHWFIDRFGGKSELHASP